MAQRQIPGDFFLVEDGTGRQSQAPGGTFILTISGAVVSVLRPDSTSSAGGWLTNTGGSNLHTAIDEGSADDSDYIISASNPTADVCKIGLSDFTNFIATGYIGHVRYYKLESGGSATINLRVRVLEGSTARASWTFSNIGTSAVTAELSLSSSEAASITDATNLYLEFCANP